MPPDTSTDNRPEKGDLRVLLRFLPMLWPVGETGLRVRVVVSILLVLASKGIEIAVPYFYKYIVDGLSGDS